MWPKAIAQIVELLPHVTRLLPMADKFLASKTAGEEANRKALEAMADGLRGDLGQVTAAHSGLYRQLNEQSEKLVEIAAGQSATRAAALAAEARVEALEKRLDKQAVLLMGTGLVSVVMLVLVILLFLRGR